MTRPVYRAGTGEDVEAAVDVFLESLTDLYRRIGAAPPAFPRDGVVTVYDHIRRTGVLEVADVDGELVSIACGIVRGPVWFMSGFWTRPAWQGRGIGGALLDRADDAARRRGATVLSTWSSLDLGAFAMYLRRGMLPGFPTITVAGPVAAGAEIPAGVEALPLSIEVAVDIDRSAAFPDRAVDHAFWLEGAGGHRGWEVRHDGRTVGYVQVDGERVGPAAWLDDDPAVAAAVLGVGIAAVARDSGHARLSIPGVNHDALRYAFDLGLRVASWGTFLTTEPFGDLRRYVTSGPLLF